MPIARATHVATVSPELPDVPPDSAAIAAGGSNTIPPTPCGVGPPGVNVAVGGAAVPMGVGVRVLVAVGTTGVGVEVGVRVLVAVG
jgi:hypothetical protein